MMHLHLVDARYLGSASKSYQRPMSSAVKEAMSQSAAKDYQKSIEDDLKALRFTRQVSAFDVDIGALEERPWRNKNVDMLDFFNYGFNEKTWLVSLSISSCFSTKYKCLSFVFP